MKLSKDAFTEVSNWVRMNARPLEMAMWEHIFEGAPVDKAISILAVYQNPDGGFGHGLEPDLWTPYSTAYTTSKALEIILKLNVPECAREMINRALDYLSGVSWNGDLWPFTMSVNEEAPHAPWWNPSEETNAIESAGMSVSIATMILALADKDSAIYARALRIAENAFGENREGSEMGTAALCRLVKELCKINYKGAEALIEQVGALVERDIERNPAKWPQHTHRPSEFIGSPNCPYYEANAKLLEKEIEFTINEREPGGVWPLTWTWYDNMDKYVGSFYVAENQWKSMIAIDKLLFFKVFSGL